MQITPQVTTSHLLVGVRVQNEFEEPIYLKHWLLDWFGLLGIPEQNATMSPETANFTRELAYACSGAPGEVVLLSGNGPSFPPHVSPMYPRVPRCSLLSPQAALEWTIKLPLPLREWYAYEMPTNENTRPIQVHTVRYRLEFNRKSKTRGTITELVDSPGVFNVSGVAETFEAVAPLPTPVTLLLRMDPFERFA